MPQRVFSFPTDATKLGTADALTINALQHLFKHELELL